MAVDDDKDDIKIVEIHADLAQETAALEIRPEWYLNSRSVVPG